MNHHSTQTVAGRGILLLLLCGLAWFVNTVRAEDPKPQKPLDILFILTDDLGWADLQCYGSDLHETPNLDRLASQGVRFTDAYAASSVCSPTRASIMTGKSPARLHMTVWAEAALIPPKDRKLIPPVAVDNLSHNQVTFAKVLQEAGYLTAHVGKWHLGDAAHYPETHGFDINIGGSMWGAPETHFFPYRGSKTWGDGYRYVPSVELGTKGEYLADRLTDEAMKLIDAAGDKPFFLNLAYYAVHTPIEAKPSDINHFKDKLKPGLHHKNVKYAAMVYNLDENIGRILKKLDERGLANNTIVIFVSDNGGFINEFAKEKVTDNYPLRSGKGALYEGGIRVPLIIRWPGITPAGKESHEPVISTDFYPTILEMTHLPGNPKHNTDLDGLSLVPLLKNPDAKLQRDALFFHFPHYYVTTTPASSVRADDWKLIEYFEGYRLELYNLKDDPSEKKNLIFENPNQARKLRMRLREWRESMDAQLPVTNPNFKGPIEIYK
jgi:arylsulfatase A